MDGTRASRKGCLHKRKKRRKEIHTTMKKGKKKLLAKHRKKIKQRAAVLVDHTPSKPEMMHVLARVRNVRVNPRPVFVGVRTLPADSRRVVVSTTNP